MKIFFHKACFKNCFSLKMIFKDSQPNDYNFRTNMIVIKNIRRFLCYFLAFNLIINVYTKHLPQSCQQLSFLPMPKKLSCNFENKEEFKIQDPCAIFYSVSGSEKNKEYGHFFQVIQHMQLKTFGCHIPYVSVDSTKHPKNQFKLIGFQYQVDIKVKDPTLQSVFQTSDEAYTLKITQNGANIVAQKYVGFIRGLETLMQAISCDRYEPTNCYIPNLPIQIQDEPSYVWRGLMVDTARHYQPIKLLYETVDALMYNKMSVMHWHIVDEDSFPLLLEKHPEIAKYGAFSSEEIYTVQQVRDLVRYAMVRGVRIVPELDTPGHAYSWGRAPEHKQNACLLKRKGSNTNGYMGPLDVTLDSTYTLMKEVFEEIFQLFPDPVVHLGGDEVVLSCFANITQFLLKEGIDQNSIQIQYRRKQRKILMQLNPNKTLMYWEKSSVAVESSDIVHWWGKLIPQDEILDSIKGKVVFSLFGPFYIDRGVGNYFGVQQGNYSTWLDIYGQNVDEILSKSSLKDKFKKHVLGLELTLWSELSNRFTHHMKIWVRGSAMAERAWTEENFEEHTNFFRRLTAHEQLLNRRGIPTTPVAPQKCQQNADFCLNNNEGRVIGAQYPQK